jgi:hypothetical protein
MDDDHPNGGSFDDYQSWSPDYHHEQRMSFSVLRTPDAWLSQEDEDMMATDGILSTEFHRW